ncbi:ABC transporter permease, partial [Aggregatibacter actinomycetemcomitans]
MLEMLPFTLPEVGAMLLTHLWLSLSALLIAVVIAVPIAVLLSRKRHMAEIVLQFTNVLQTIPSLALLGLLIPFVGIGSPPVLIALTLYALLPIFQNAYLGLSQIDQSIQDAYTAFGLSRWQSLWRIELPMALPAMMSGIRTAAVLIIGTATLAALIGA